MKAKSAKAKGRKLQNFVVKELRKRQEFTKPSEVKRKQKQKAVYKAKFLAENDEQFNIYN